MYLWKKWVGHGRDGYGQRTWFDLVKDGEELITVDSEGKKAIDELVTSIKNGGDLQPTPTFDASKGVPVPGSESGTA